MEDDVIGGIARDLKLSRAKVLAVLDLWDERTKPTPAQKQAATNKILREVMDASLLGGLSRRWSVEQGDPLGGAVAVAITRAYRD